MYVNLDNIFKLKDPLMLPLLLILKHAAKKDVSEKIQSLGYKDTDYSKLQVDGYIKFIKGTNKQTLLQKMRLDKKGTQYLNSLQDPEITENDTKMFDYLCEMYLSHEDTERHIGNKKKTLQYCAEFRQILELDVYEMYWLCWMFLQEHQFTKKLEYIFFNSNKNRYGTFRGNLGDSPLYQFLDNKRPEIEAFWKSKISKK